MMKWEFAEVSAIQHCLKRVACSFEQTGHACKQKLKIIRCFELILSGTSWIDSTCGWRGNVNSRASQAVIHWGLKCKLTLQCCVKGLPAKKNIALISWSVIYVRFIVRWCWSHCCPHSPFPANCSLEAPPDKPHAVDVSPAVPLLWSRKWFNHDRIMIELGHAWMIVHICPKTTILATLIFQSRTSDSKFGKAKAIQMSKRQTPSCGACSEV